MTEACRVTNTGCQMVNAFGTHMLRLLISLAFLAPIAACSDSATALDGKVTATTDSASFSLPTSGHATVTGQIRNGINVPVTFTGCPSPPAFGLEQFAAGKWNEVSDWGLVCLAIFGPSTVKLDPGDELPFSFPFWMRGEFRMRVLVGPRWGEPESTLLSNTFQIQ